MLFLRSVFSAPMAAPAEAEEAAKLPRRSICKRSITGGLSRVRDFRRKLPREAWSRPMDDSKTLPFWSQLINSPIHFVTQHPQHVSLGGSHWAPCLHSFQDNSIPNVFSRRVFNETCSKVTSKHKTQPPITLAHMVTLLSCIPAMTSSDPGSENKQPNDETKSVTRAPPIIFTSHSSN